MPALMPYTVRVEDGREYRLYVVSAAQAAVDAEYRSGKQAVLIIRADEPFVRRPSRLRRLVNWIEK
jgi:hypothetical protein